MILPNYLIITQLLGVSQPNLNFENLCFGSAKEVTTCIKLKHIESVYQRFKD